jgi:hypothetical protein
MAELIGAPAAVGRHSGTDWPVLGGTTALSTLLTPCRRPESGAFRRN